MIYLFLKRILKWAFFIFFRKKVVSGTERIPSNGPLIIAVNHPNTLVDPLLVGSQIKRKVGFLANASIFINSIVKAIFNHFSVIPVYRKKDLQPGQVQDNSSSFYKCYEFFDKNGAILIFPEGTSVNELKLRDIKTGTARIALGYEEERDFPGTLNINTVALSYSDSLRFRSMVSMYVNPSFKVKEYEKLYKTDKELAIKSLTARIEKEIAGQVTLTDNKEQEHTVLQAQKFYMEYIDPSISRYMDPVASFELRKEMAIKIRLLEENKKSIYTSLSEELNDYFKKVEGLNISPGFFRNSFLVKSSLVVLIAYLLQLAFLLPFYIIGLITNYIPYKIPDWIFEATKVDEEYKSSISIIIGMIVFPLFYVLDVYLFKSFIHVGLLSTLIFILALPFLGFTVLFYWKIATRFSRLFRFYFKIKQSDKEKIIAKRDSLEQLIQSL